MVAPWSQVAAAAPSLTGARPFLAAMHVHGSSSEQEASWEAYGPRGQGLVDVIFMTDHDYRALADGYWTSLADVPFRNSSSGGLAQKATTRNGGALRLLAESAGASSPASVTMAIDTVTTQIVQSKLRSSIAGTSLRHTFGTCQLTNGATYEVRVTLSVHPAHGSRPSGQFQLWYRFGSGLADGRHLESGGLVGVVTRGLPATGSAVDLELEPDVAALWPDMIAGDNVFFQLTFVAKSPKRGAVADIAVAGVQFVRTGHDPASIAGLQRQMADTYGARYGLTMHPGIEVGRGMPHLNAFTSPQYVPDQALNVAGSKGKFYRQAVDGAHARGGLASWNHPLGFTGGPLLTPTEQVSKRRRVFASMKANNLYGADILEVGYNVRGQADTASHAALWDTFSRHARFLTGNGANDDHKAKDWRTLGNGFATGIWASSVDHADLLTALQAGRAFAAHAGKFEGGQLDLLVDGSVPMGKVSVSTKNSRTLDVFATNLPTGGTVEIIAGPVDFTGNDPGTVVLETVAAGAFGPGGTLSRAVDTSRSSFVRTQVRDAGGTIVGIGNPVWLLRQPPPGGIPTSRMP